jgi:ADP-ribosylglycohydrolase
LIANANVGGDSAARGIVIGILLGAVHGEEAIPARWLATLRVLPRVRELLQSLEGAKDEL